MGLLLSNVLAPTQLESWGWRVAFLIGILVIPVGLIIRRRLEETAAPHSDREADATLPLLREHRRALVASILLMIGVASSTYIIVYYLSNYAVSVLHMPLSLGIWAACVASVVQVLLSPFAGWLADQVGRRKVVLWSRVALLVMVYPAFALINAEPSLARLLIVVGCLSVPMSMTSPASMVLVSEVLPQRLRATGLSIAYCVAIAIFGGFAQFFSTELIHLTGNANAPALYVMLVGVTIASIVLHELGHCLTAIRFGVHVPRILLLPIGGMAEFDGIPREPRREVLGEPGHHHAHLPGVRDQVVVLVHRDRRERG